MFALVYFIIIYLFFFFKRVLKDVIHSVGPIDEDPKDLESCYKTLLDLILKHNIRTVAVCGIATVNK
jgi:hypothetical protein